MAQKYFVVSGFLRERVDLAHKARPILAGDNRIGIIGRFGERFGPDKVLARAIRDPNPTE